MPGVDTLGFLKIAQCFSVGIRVEHYHRKSPKSYRSYRSHKGRKDLGRRWIGFLWDGGGDPTRLKNLPSLAGLTLLDIFLNPTLKHWAISRTQKATLRAIEDTEGDAAGDSGTQKGDAAGDPDPG